MLLLPAPKLTPLDPSEDTREKLLLGPASLASSDWYESLECDPRAAGEEEEAGRNVGRSGLPLCVGGFGMLLEPGASRDMVTGKAAEFGGALDVVSDFGCRGTGQVINTTGRTGYLCDRKRCFVGRSVANQPEIFGLIRCPLCGAGGRGRSLCSSIAMHAPSNALRLWLRFGYH